MSQHAFIFSAPPAWLVELLSGHLPHCIPLFMNLRSAQIDGAKMSSSHARTLFVSEVETLEVLEGGAQKPREFAAAYVDFAQGPGTEMHVYSTMERERQQQQEDGDDDCAAREANYRKQLKALQEGVNRIREEYGRDTSHGSRVLVGTLHTGVRRVLEQLGFVEPRPSGFFDKWLIDPKKLPPLDQSLPEGLHWSKPTYSDGCVMVARTDIPREADELLRLPTLVVKLQDETPVAWASLGTDGSLMNLYCEEPYRRKGLARKLAIKLLHDNKARYEDGACMTVDVTATNHASRSVCMALNGKPHWEVSWVYLLLSSS